MNVSDRTTAAQVISAIDSTGTKAPKAILDAYADAQRVSTAARNLHPAATPSPRPSQPRSSPAVTQPPTLRCNAS